MNGNGTVKVPARATRSYFQEVLRREISEKLGGHYLTKEQESEMCRRMHEGDAEARELLILSGVNATASVALRFLRSGDWTSEDLVSMGLEALVSKIDRFDSRRGRLTTFISYVVWRALSKLCKEQRSVIRVPCNSRFCEKRRLAWNVRSLTSLEPPGTEEPMVLSDTSSLEDKKAVVNAAIGLLSEKQRNIIRLRYFDGKTLQSIGNMLGVSKERARQLVAAALQKVRKTLIDSGRKTYDDL